VAVPKGFKHSYATRLKMSRARKGRRHSAEHRAAIAAGCMGRKQPLRYKAVCVCGQEFLSGAHNARFCSVRCGRASRGHGLIHSVAFAAFDKSCSICGGAFQLVGDHNHGTGKARGILCRNCNLAIGNMKDDPVRLRKAADYLEERV
jgi:hypothetical protein